MIDRNYQCRGEARTEVDFEKVLIDGVEILESLYFAVASSFVSQMQWLAEPRCI